MGHTIAHSYTHSMKTLSALTFLAASSHAWNQEGIYFEKNFNWAAMDDDLISAVDAGYNRIYISFYMSLFGCQGACAQWASTPDIRRQEVFNYAKDRGAKIYLSIGGPGEFVEKVWEDGETYQSGIDAAKFAWEGGY